ncbi:MAG: hypothetical protein EOP07_14020 [Proteobacteria bacterium]|nr:MAG: hypothetical protein EOP07_14020 [Pseudomonadota bacterium]
MKNLLIILLTVCPSLAFAGQHSGLGGTPPTPPPPQQPAPESSFEEYNRWIQDQIEEALRQLEPEQK